MSAVTARAECSIETAATLGTKPHPSVEQAKVLDTEDRIIIRPVASGRELANEAFEPIRIGFMSEIPGGSDIGLGVFLDPLILAFEDAINEGRLKRGVELLPLHVNGLPAGSEKNVKQAYLELVDAGCVLVLSIGVTDNALVLCDLVNESKVPYITMGGTTRFVGPHCFSLPNGGHGEEIAIVAAYCASQGYRKVVLTGERSPGDTEYQMFFREQARLYGIEILKEHYFDQRPTEDELDAGFRQIRELGPDALVYAGFGWNSSQINPSLERIGWDPPKVMNAAIMWALGSEAWADALDGWVGIEQTLGDHEDIEKNRNWGPALDRFEKRFSYRMDNTVFALIYDQGRTAAEAINNAPLLTGEGISAGIERIKLMPSVLGGPRTYIEFGPYNHRGYKGDFLFLKQLRNRKFHFTSYHWPEWTSNSNS
jgi:branched-chain amino acid transport system substrate-binding protein